MRGADEIIEEVRRSRVRMSEECGHDVGRYLQMLQDANRRYAEQVRRYQELRRVVGTADEASR